jgi:hypothetical protein
MTYVGICSLLGETSHLAILSNLLLRCYKDCVSAISPRQVESALSLLTCQKFSVMVRDVSKEAIGVTHEVPQG